MLTFSEWCSKKFGIKNITEGKIIKKYFLPLDKHPFFNQPYYHSILAKYLASAALCVKDGKQGYVLSAWAYKNLANELAYHHVVVHGEEYKTPAPFYVNIAPHNVQAFINQFAAYSPQVNYNPLAKRQEVYIPSEMLDVLYRQYHNENKPSESISSLKTRLNNLKSMQKDIDQNKLQPYLQKAHILSLDYDNNQKVACSIFEASSSYALSLQIFAETHKSTLSNEQYLALMHAASSLAIYDKHGTLQQGLKSDSNFSHYITRRLAGGRRYKPDHSLPLISELTNSRQIMREIENNATILLHGRRNAPLGKGKTFDALRFLPDKDMNSETNEIILQTGGMINHSAMARIIKVGMLKDGSKAQPHQKPDYFEYYKVETNLGAGCHDAEWTYKTCEGTHITRLWPTRSHNGVIQNFNIDPVTQPHLYQQMMEHTLFELIKAEREISFYRQPQQGPNGEGASPTGSAEAHEWTRLKDRLNRLNGTPVTHPVVFEDLTQDGQVVRCTVENQRGYLQEGGSCPIFSIKQLVTSIIGHELASVHSHFLQTQNGTQHVQLVNNEIIVIERLIASLKADANNILASYVLYLTTAQRNSYNVHPQNFTASQIESLSEFPELYQLAINKTTSMFQHYAKQYEQADTKHQRDVLWNSFTTVYMALPDKIKTQFAEDYKKLQEYHRSYVYLIEQIIGDGEQFQFERSVLGDKLENRKSLPNEVIDDLKILGKFYRDKQQFAVTNKIDDPNYRLSLQQFYKKSVDVLLSGKPAKEKASEIHDIAQSEFQHRHSTRRLIADIALLITTLFGVGIAVGVGRKLTGHTYFFSNAPTAREKEVTSLFKKDVDDDAEHVFSPEKPQL